MATSSTKPQGPAGPTLSSATAARPGVSAIPETAPHSWTIPPSYEPRFGGYDPIAIGRGAPTSGNPEIWLIWGQKLYLFYDPQTREEFMADPRRIDLQAEARWPDVLKHVLSQ